MFVSYFIAVLVLITPDNEVVLQYQNKQISKKIECLRQADAMAKEAEALVVGQYCVQVIPGKDV